MNTRQALIAKALRQRYTQVCRHLESLDASAFNAPEEFVSRVRELVQPQPPRANSEHNDESVWSESELDCLQSLRKLALGEDFASRECSPPNDPDFMETLRAASRDRNESFRLLTTRYAHPLNFSSPSEDSVREHVLERLMVQDRARLEGDHSISIDDDVLLRLNLIAIHSNTTSDLRFLDALNYHYELLFPNRSPNSQHTWLFVSFLALYARALSVRAEDN